MYALTNCTLYTGDQVLQNYALLIESARILDLVPERELTKEIPQIDGQGWAAAPGFIDLQLNGCGGVMFNDAITVATLDTMHHTNLKSGTTSFLPTLITTSDEAMRQAMMVVKHYRHQHPNRVLGLHLEGPYLNPKRGGIHDASFIRSPDQAMVEEWVKAGTEVVKLVTLAPEVVSVDLIHTLVAVGIVVSAGHTEASFETAMAGFEAGISMVTHLFNAMSPWLGRTPGVVGAALSRSEIYTGVIVDGHHVHYGSVQLAQRLKQDKLLLVTDATPAAGGEVESFMIGGQEVFYKDGKCVSAAGTLGGSALTMIEAVQNCVKHVGISLAEALRMATLYPARAINVDQQLGRLAPAYQADVVLFDPQSFTVQGVIEQGQLQWIGSKG
jgi:N-acetylglucosamine-6-phosphate deacetylase